MRLIKAARRDRELVRDLLLDRVALLLLSLSLALEEELCWGLRGRGVLAIPLSAGVRAAVSASTETSGLFFTKSNSASTTRLEAGAFDSVACISMLPSAVADIRLISRGRALLLD
jgi:hypothetical protein